jgi:catechol 2,3-dioxygenase-like lactoylglutathione lyase family enzyme
MRITHIDHYNIRCRPSDLAALRAFYCGVIGLTEGARPDFDFPGSWLYGGAEAAILHLAATLPEAAEGIRPDKPTGQFDHISLKCTGMESARARLAEHGIAFDERPVPGWRMNQFFLNDPAGLKIELTFDLEREANQSHPPRAAQ